MENFIKPVLAAGIIAGAFLFTACEKPDLAEPSATIKTASSADAKTVSRPFSDYLDAQGTTANVLPPVPDFIGWTDPQTADPLEIRWVSVDYNATSAQYLNENHGFSIPTTVSGSIKETQTPNGVFVTIKIHTENALTFSLTNFPTPELPAPDFLNDPLDFGYRPHELIANPSLQPALGTIDISITFNNEVPGADIPDFSVLLDPNQELILSVKDLSVKSTSTGTFHAASGFPEGAQGTVKNQQRGLIHLFSKGNGVSLPTKDLFPREHIIYSLK
jgi:hypothetical protein